MSRKRSAKRSRNSLSISDEVDIEYEHVSSVIDRHINRYKQTGKTFDLLHVVKLAAVKMISDEKANTISSLYFGGNNGGVSASDHLRRSNNISSIVENMIRAESY